MPLSELNPASARPRGGVSKVELIPASLYAGVVPPSVPWAFREDRAHYSEQQIDGATPTTLVRHTLEMDIPADRAGRAAVQTLRATADSEGIVALVTMASGDKIVVGWSNRFGTLYPLRLTAAKALSGRSPADFPTISLTLESIDADGAGSAFI